MSNSFFYHPRCLLFAILSLGLASCSAKSSYEAKTTDDVTISISDGKKTYSSTHSAQSSFSIVEGSVVCLQQGDGHIEMDNGQGEIIILKKSTSCVYLPAKAHRSFSNMISQKMEQIFPPAPSGEESVAAVHRSTDGVYTDPIYLNDKDYLVIDNARWLTSASRLPIVLKVISPTGEVVEQFESHRKGFTSFILPRERLEQSDGYRIEISNQRGEKLLASPFFLHQKKSDK